MRLEDLERIYKDAKEIKIRLENDPETVLVLEEITKNGKGDAFEDLHYDLGNCLDEIFRDMENGTNSHFIIHLVDEADYYRECQGYCEYVGHIAINSLINEEIKVIYEDYKATKDISQLYIETNNRLVWTLKRDNLDGLNVVVEDYGNNFKKVVETILPTENAELGEIDIIIGAADMLAAIDRDSTYIYDYLYDEGSLEYDKIEEYLKKERSKG